MAVRLEDEGDKVSAVILMDTRITVEADASTDNTQSHEDAVQEQLIELADICDIDEANISIQIEAFLRRLMQELSLPFYAGIEDFIRAFVFIDVHNERIMVNSDYGVCNAPILYARAAKVSHSLGGYTGSAWDSFTRAGVTSFDVDTDHRRMDSEDASKELADYIGPYLEKTICE